jgi:catechol 2,3-dioxygenase-like lactoylglutathione lyase family enzyme
LNDSGARSTENPIKGLGEVVLRVKDIDTMQAFYEDVIGLELLQRFGNTHAFFRIADGYGGHTQIVALFAESVAPQLEFLSRANLDVSQTTLHHFALEIPLAAYQAQKDRLEARGLAVRTMTHPWIGWRSIYVADPEGNVVELVCYDRSVLHTTDAM